MSNFDDIRPYNADEIPAAMQRMADSNVIPVTLAVSPDGSQVAFDNDRDGCIYVIDLTY